MGLRDRLAALLTPIPAYEDRDYWPFANVNGHTYPIPLLNQTLQGTREEIGGDFEGLAYGAYRGDGIVFACMQARMALFAEARFMFRQLRSGTPGELFSGPELDILRTPWPNGTTGDLLSRMIQDVDLGGNAFVARRPGNRLARLRPSWVDIVLTEDTGNLDALPLGYVYHPGGRYSGRDPVVLQRSEVAHFAPTPDPIAQYRGMSWLVALLYEIEADKAATAHKLAYFVNGATPNLVVTKIPGATPQAFAEWVEKFSGKHKGVRNAYETMFLSGEADAKVVGNDMAQIDFKVTQGAGETRIAAAAGTPPVVVGLSEGMQGSSLNAGNFQSAMRRFADVTMRPLWRNAAGSLATLVQVPKAAELWYDDRAIPALKDDIKDAAEVQQLNASAVRQYVDAGFDPDAVIDAVNAGDLSRLRGSHSGLFSVQLQPPQPNGPPVTAPVPEVPA